MSSSIFSSPSPRSDALGDAVPDVTVEEPDADGPEGRHDRVDLRQDVDAVLASSTIRCRPRTWPSILRSRSLSSFSLIAYPCIVPPIGWSSARYQPCRG